MLILIAYLIPIFAMLVMLVILMQGESRHMQLTVSFRVLLIFLISWLTLLWLADQINNPPISIVLVRLALCIASFAPAIFYYFGTRLINSSNKRILITLIAISFVFGVLSLSPYLITSVDKGTVGISIPQESIAYILQTAYSATVLVFTYIWLRKEAHHLDQKNVAQIKAMGNGLIAALLLGLLGGVVRQAANHLILPLALTIFAASMFIAIFKHGLFDIRSIVARSVAYIFSLLAVGVAFGLLTFAIASIFIKSSRSIDANLRIAYTIIAVMLAIIFPQVKKFFDRATRTIFYRDGYDVQVFLDSFNKVLVSTYDLNKLLNLVSIMIEENLKPTYCLFGLLEDEGIPKRIIGTKRHPQIEESDINFIRHIADAVHGRVIVTELLEQKFNNQRIQLQKRGISIITKLATSNEREGSGYLILGPKKSGSMYTSQDIKVLEIVSNELVVAIQNSLHTEEIEQFNVTLQSRIKDATHKLRSTNEKLRALDEAKDDFLSMASHQLRTPLTSIKGNISLVLDGDAGTISDIQRQMLQQAYGSSQRMVYLIADLLNVSRLKTGKFLIERTPVDLALVIQDEISQLQETAKSRNLTLSYVMPNQVTELMLDNTKTRQVIMNFVDNAIYYTPAGGRIDIVLKETSASIECRVIDNGIGVPKSEQHHLFTKFYRASNARKARPDGTGLGLFMAKKVIATEGGSVIFDTLEGKGSTFGFSFPKKTLAVSPDYKLDPANQPVTTA